MTLSKAAIKLLRIEAHRQKLKPVVMIGQNGLTDNVETELELALSHHELIKIRIPALDKTDKKQLIKRVCDRHQASLIHSIGNIAIMYRRNIKNDRFASLATH